MSDRPEGVLVRMLRWVNSGVGRLLEKKTGRTEQQVDKTQLAIGRIIEQLNRIEKRLEDIERRLPPRRYRIFPAIIGRASDNHGLL